MTAVENQVMLVKASRVAVPRGGSSCPPWLAASAVTLLSALLLAAYVLRGCGGQAWACYHTSAVFPIPAVVRSFADIRPTMEGGWDGQFYLFQSYDPFLRHPEATHTAFDAAAYRYQRNLIPTVTWLLGHLPTPLGHAAWYMIVQLSVMLWGSCVVAQFLVERGRSLWWLVPMHFNTGVLMTLWHGLPDASTDFLLYMAFVFVMTARVRYATACLLALCLSREPYTLFAACLAAATPVGCWQPLRRWTQRLRPTLCTGWRRARLYEPGLYGLPCIIFVAWWLYVRHRLHGSPTTQGQFMLGLPLLGLGQALARMAQEGLGMQQFIFTLYYFLAFAVTLILVIQRLEQGPLFWALIVLCGLNSCIGWLGWYGLAHCSKNFSYCLGLWPLLLASGRSGRWQGYALGTLALPALLLSFSALRPQFCPANPLPIHGFYSVDLEAGYLAAHPANREALLAEVQYDAARAVPTVVQLVRPQARLELIKAVVGVRARAPTEFTVVASNTGTEAWSPFFHGDVAPVQFDVTLKDATGRIVQHSRRGLNRFVYPEQLTTVQLALMAPRVPGRYSLEVTMAQGNTIFGTAMQGSGRARAVVDVRPWLAL